MTDCATVFSQHPEPAAAVGEVVGGVLERIDPHPDLAIMFASGPHAEGLEEAANAVNSLLAPEIIVATTAPRIFGGAVDQQTPAGLSLFALHRRGLRPLRLEHADGTITGLPSSPHPGSTALILGAQDFPTTLLLTQLELDGLGEGRTVVSVVGACHLRTGQAASPRLILDGTCYDSGAVGVLFGPGSVSVRELGVTEPHDERDPVPSGLVGLGDASGLLLFADNGVNMVDGPSLDFEIVFEQFGGSMAGLVGASLLHPQPSMAGRFMPRATALILEPPGDRRPWNQ